MKKLICIVLVAGCAIAHAAKDPDAVDKAIEKGLEFLLAAQKDNGSFTGQYGDTVAIASLALPRDGTRSRRLEVRQAH